MNQSIRRTDPQGLLFLAAGLSLAAAVIHGIVTPEHFEEWWGYGTFFLVTTIAQALYGLMLLPQGRGYMRLLGLRADRARDLGRFYWLGIIGNAAIILLWAITRTLGVPLFGPDAGEVEEVTLISLASVILEVVLIGCLFLLMQRAQREAVS